MMDDGTLSSSPDDILSKWKTDFQNLLNNPPSGEFDNEFLNEAKLLTAKWENEIEQYGYHDDVIFGNEKLFQSVQLLNSQITLDETEKVIRNCKCNKAVGADNVANEVLKSKILAPVLNDLFNFCFMNNVIPCTWKKSLIKPILKQGKDNKLPLS